MISFAVKNGQEVVSVFGTKISAVGLKWQSLSAKQLVTPFPKPEHFSMTTVFLPHSRICLGMSYYPFSHILI